MPGEERDRRRLVGADADLLAAVAAVFGSEHELVLILVEVALRPAVIAALLDGDDLLGRQIRALLHRVELRPVLRELIAAVLGRVKLAGGIEREAFAVADAGGIAVGGG